MQSEVGKGKPPKEHQFKPGQSGNPKGKAPGTFSLKKQLRLALSEIGKGNKEPYYMLLVKRIMSKAIASGDNKMIELIWNYLEGKPKGEDDGGDLGNVFNISKIVINHPHGEKPRNKPNGKAVRSVPIVKQS